MGSESKQPTTPPVPGRDAESPTEFCAESWLQISKRVWKSFLENQISFIASGIAFYTFLGLFPAFAAIVSVYGFFVDPGEVESQISTYLGTLPFEVREVLLIELRRISSSGVAGRAAIIAAAVALWGGSKSASAFMRGMNLVYRERESRGLFKKRATALFLTTGVIAMILVGISLMGGLPFLLGKIYLGELWIERLLLILRWPVATVLLLGAIAFLYRFGPDRSDANWRWISFGAILAAALIVLSSWGFGFFISHFGNYNKTYGSLGTVVVLLLWLQIITMGILIGGLLNAHLELQTAKDTTTGIDKPMGERGAHVADNVSSKSDHV